MLESILDRFSKSKPEVVVPKVEQPKPVPSKPASQAAPTECPVCHAATLATRRQTSGFCFQCDPPPALSMIGAESGVPRIIDQFAYYAGMVICTCGCHQVVESYWSDGGLLIVLLAQNLLTHRLSNKVPA